MRNKKYEKNITVKEGGIWSSNKAKEAMVQLESIPSADERMGMRFNVPDGVDIVKRKKEAESVKAVPWKMKVPEDGIGIWDINNDRILQLPMDACSNRSRKKTIEVNRINGGSKIEISPHPFRKTCDIELEIYDSSHVLKHKAIKYLGEENGEYLAKINFSDIVFIDFTSKK